MCKDEKAPVVNEEGISFLSTRYLMQFLGIIIIILKLLLLHLESRGVTHPRSPGFTTRLTFTVWKRTKCVTLVHCTWYGVFYMCASIEYIIPTHYTIHGVII